VKHLTATVCVAAVLSAIAADAQAQAGRRGALPDKPSVEVNFDVLNELRLRPLEAPAMPQTAPAPVIAATPAPRYANPMHQNAPLPIPQPVAQPAPQPVMPQPVPQPVAPVVHAAPPPAPAATAGRRMPVGNQALMGRAAPAPQALPPVVASVPPASSSYSTYQMSPPPGSRNTSVGRTPSRPARPAAVKPAATHTPKPAPVAQPAPKTEIKPAVAAQPAPQPVTAPVVTPPAPVVVPQPAPQPVITQPAAQPALPDLPPLNVPQTAPAQPQPVPQPAAPQTPAPLPVPDLSDVEFNDFPDLPATAPAIAPSAPELPGLGAITGTPDEDLNMAPALPSAPAELPPLEAITGAPAMEEDPLAGLPPLSEMQTPPQPQSAVDGLPELPDMPDMNLPEPTAPAASIPVPPPVQMPAEMDLPELPDMGATAPAMPDLPSLPDMNDLPDIAAPTAPAGLPPLPSASAPPLDDMPLPDLDAIGMESPAPAAAPVPQETAIASLPPEPVMPSSSAPDKLVIEFGETENDIPVSMHASLNALAQRLISENKGVVVRPYVGSNGDGQMASLISTRRAFNVRTWLIDKGVPQLRITIDRSQPSDAGGAERVELIVE
jgi:hypothetical protein